MKSIVDVEDALVTTMAYLDTQILSPTTSPTRTHELKLMRHTVSCTLDFINTPHTDKIQLT